MKPGGSEALELPRRLRRALVVGAVATALVLPGAAAQRDSYESMRRDMVEYQLRGRGISQSSLLNAMETVPRHLFVPVEVRDDAYLDSPVPSEQGEGSVMQPYLSARMIELLELDDSHKVLEIGTGSGYDAAVLSRLAHEVYTIEISEDLGREARERLKSLGYQNVFVKVGDGHMGWPEEAPFDAIILTAAPEDVPQKLLDQLRMNGRMVVAVGARLQNLTLIEKTPEGVLRKRVEPVRISPMSAEH